MSTWLVVIGLLLIIVGAIWFLFPVGAAVRPERSADIDVAAVFAQVNVLLEKFDKRYRPGLILMIVGLTVLAMGVYWETRDASAAPAALPVMTAHLH